MKRIRLTRGKEALVDDIDYQYLMQWSWCAIVQNNGWRAMRKNGKKTRYMHQEIADRIDIKGDMIDHRDRNPLNNRRDNLRPSTQSQNLHNRGPQKNNTTGVKGVWFCKRAEKYVAEVSVEGKKHWLGHFATVVEAEKVVIAKRVEILGEYAYTKESS